LSLYDKKVREYNNILKVLSGSRKKEHQKEMAEYHSNTQTAGNTSNNVGAGALDRPLYGSGTNKGRGWNSSPATTNVDKQTGSGYNGNAKWDKPTYDDEFKKDAENQWYNKIAHGSFKEDDWLNSMVKNQEKAQSWYNNTYGEKDGKKEYQSLHNRLINTPLDKIKEEEKQFAGYKVSDFKVPELQPVKYSYTSYDNNSQSAKSSTSMIYKNKYSSDSKVYIALDILDKAKEAFPSDTDNIEILQKEIVDIAEKHRVDNIDKKIQMLYNVNDGLKKMFNFGELNLSTVEQILAVAYPYDALQIHFARNKADEETKVKYKQSGNGTDASNAFKHIYWNAYATNKIGAEKTKLFSDAHEYGWYDQNINHPEYMYMDLYNNELGRYYGENYALDRLIEAITFDIAMGKAKIIKNEKSVFSTPGWDVKK
jgi:hypothetical protein